MNNLPDILNEYESISLKEMDSVKLMDRMDTKFTFNASDLFCILHDMINDYYVLEIGGKRLSTYKTLYYDTSDLRLYHHHHNGHLNRYKIRHRSYVDTDTGYLEVKFKSNKGRTIKERIKKKFTPDRWEKDISDFLSEKTPFDPDKLHPALWVNYKRITLVNKENTERVTIDVDLEFITENAKQRMNNLVIAEVKQERKRQSVFLSKMKKLYVRQGSISKYCLGIALTKPTVKANNFKEKIVSLKKIIYDSKFNFANR